MPIVTSPDQLIECLRKSGLVESRRLDEAMADLAGALTGEPKALAQALIRRGILTAWQASQLLSGKSRGFYIGGGKYRLMDLLGAGGMGTVYLCEHTRMQRLVALKVLPTNRLGDPDHLERFEREARAAGALDHPNIVRAFDLDRDGDLHFLVMEYIDGASLHRIVAKSGPLAPLRACHYVAQAAEGLQYAHLAAGLVHRDVKPGNILVDRAGVVKLLDMGLSRFLREAEGSITHKHDRESILGTADYLAPEQGENSADVDIRADIYSLGATFYFLLAGRPVFEGGSVAQKIHRHQTKMPDSLRSKRPEISRELEEILFRMLAKKPDERYQEPAEVAAALAPWCARVIDPPTDDEMPQLCPATTALFPAGPRSASGSAVSVLGRSSRPGRNPNAASTPGKPASRAWLAVLIGTALAIGGVIWWTTTPLPTKPSPALNLPVPRPTIAASGVLPGGETLPPSADGTIYVSADPRRKAAVGSRRDIVESFGEALALAEPAGRIVVLDGAIEGQFRIDGARVAGLTIEGRADTGRPIVWRAAEGNPADQPLLTLSHAGAACLCGIEFDGEGRIETLIRIEGESGGLKIEHAMLRGVKAQALAFDDWSAPAENPATISDSRFRTARESIAIRLSTAAAGQQPALRVRVNRFEGPFAATIAVDAPTQLEFTLNRLGTLQSAGDSGAAIVWRTNAGRLRATSNTTAGFSSLLRIDRATAAESSFVLRSNLMIGGTACAMAATDIDAAALEPRFAGSAGNVARPGDANAGIPAVGKVSIPFGPLDMNPESDHFLRYRPTPENRPLLTAGANGEPAGVPPER